MDLGGGSEIEATAVVLRGADREVTNLLARNIEKQSAYTKKRKVRNNLVSILSKRAKRLN